MTFSITSNLQLVYYILKEKKSVRILGMEWCCCSTASYNMERPRCIVDFPRAVGRTMDKKDPIRAQVETPTSPNVEKNNDKKWYANRTQIG